VCKKGVSKMNQDKAGEEYWELVWNDKNVITKVDMDYYTNKLLHNLYNKYLTWDDTKSICEIGCAMSQNLLYFNDYFGYQINGFDYEKKSSIKTKKIYQDMGYNVNIYHHDFFDIDQIEQYDILSSFGVFEHFENLEEAIKITKRYLKNKGIILTVIPNMNGIVGFLQKKLNKKVYDVHIPYKKDDILNAHENSGYKTLYCGYYGIYQAGVVNLNGINNQQIISKILAIPGKPLYYISKLFNLKLDFKFNSPYIIYIGQKS